MRSLVENVVTHFVCYMYYIPYSYNKVSRKKENVIKIIRNLFFRHFISHHTKCIEGWVA